MNELNFSDNIVKLRHKKKITQEQLADFIGVTKASVSKWENKQSLPDILILTELAAFFDVTIDELLGYEPQLSKEQIQKLYLELAEAFAEYPFEEVMKKSEELTKKYYFYCLLPVVLLTVCYTLLQGLPAGFHLQACVQRNNVLHGKWNYFWKLYLKLCHLQCLKGKPF